MFKIDRRKDGGYEVGFGHLTRQWYIYKTENGFIVVDPFVLQEFDSTHKTFLSAVRYIKRKV